jgi:hypothetical protein
VWSFGLGLSALIPLAFLPLAPRLAMAPFAAALVTFAGGAATALVPLAVAARGPLSRRVALALAVGSVIAVVLVALTHASGAAAALTIDASLVAFAHAAGGSLGRRVADPGHLLAACIVGAAADLASVLHPAGPTHAIVESERALSLLAVSFPVPTTHAFAPVLGVGDLLFAALVLGVASAHRLSIARASACLFAGVAVAGAASGVLGGAVPAIVPIAAAVVVGMPAARRLGPRDRATTRVAAAIAIAVVLGVLLTRALS